MESFEKTNLKTLASCMNSLQADGFNENFKVDGNTIHALDSNKEYTPSQVKILNFLDLKEKVTLRIVQFCTR